MGDTKYLRDKSFYVLQTISYITISILDMSLSFKVFQLQDNDTLYWRIYLRYVLATWTIKQSFELFATALQKDKTGMQLLNNLLQNSALCLMFGMILITST